MKAALFDIDGVLFDSAEVIYQVYVEVLREHSLEAPSRETVIKEIGFTPPIWLKKLVGEKKTKELHNEIAERYSNEFFPKYAKINAEALPTLNTLRKNGFKVGVVTNQTKKQTQSTLSRIGFEFDCVKTIDDGEAKPSPDLIFKALTELNANKEESFFVGDANPDFEAGKNAKIKTFILERSYNAKLPNRIHSLSYLTNE